MASIASIKSFIIPKLKKKSFTWFINLKRDVVLEFPKASPLLPNKAGLEKTYRMGKNKRDNHIQIVSTAVLNEKPKKHRQRILDYAHSKVKEESAISKRSIENQVSFLVKYNF